MNGREGRSQLEFQNYSHCILIDKLIGKMGKQLDSDSRGENSNTPEFNARTQKDAQCVWFSISCSFLQWVCVFCVHFPVLFPFISLHSIRIRGTQWIAVAHCFHPFSNLCSRSLFDKKLWTNPMSHTSSWKDNDWTETKVTQRAT